MNDDLTPMDGTPEEPPIEPTIGEAPKIPVEQTNPARDYTSGEWHGSPYTGQSDPRREYIPNYSAPTPPPDPRPTKVKKGWTTARVIALCLVCAILGGCVGGGVFTLISSGRNQDAQPASGSSTLLESDRTTSVELQQVTAGNKMTVAEIYAEYSGSVVCIEVSTSSGGSGAGTGFVITSDGYIATCHHVIDGAAEIAVIFPDNTSYPAVLVGSDADNDIAVLKIEATGLKSVVLGNSDLLNVGDTVTTIGNALGTLSNTTTTGIVSALDRAITMSDGTVMNVLQTNCTVNSGNSGGPLFNEYGEVIGIVNAKYSSSGYSSTASIEGIGFAIPYADVEKKITDLMEFGYVTGKPSLGITVSTVSPLEAQRFNMVVGAYVNSVTAGSCAETAGLLAGDIITGVDGVEITTYEELVNAKNKRLAGDEMTFTVWRSGETLTITVILDEQKPTDNTADESQTPSDEQGGSYEEYFGNMTPEDFFEYFFGYGGGYGDRYGSGGW